MSRDWPELFRTWSKPPSDTEEEKGSNAAEMIRKAVRASDKLSKYRVEIYATGSYRNNTNVKLGSDIDLAVVLRDTFFYELPEGLTRQQLGFTGSPDYSWTDFRDDVGKALRDHFGVEVGDKSYKLRQNSYRLNADVTPFLVHRRYTGERDRNGAWEYLEGVQLLSRRTGEAVVNWHKQHYENGVAKNDATNRRYKRIARILKKLKQDMIDKGSKQASASAQAVPSFLIECLVYNTPNDKFNRTDGSYYDDVKGVIAWLFHQTKSDSTTVDDLVEVSELKALFGDHQPWTASQAHEFVAQAWRHVGFKNG